MGAISMDPDMPHKITDVQLMKVHTYTYSTRGKVGYSCSVWSLCDWQNPLVIKHGELND